MMSPHWISLPTLEGRCESRIMSQVFISSYFPRWGTRYDYGTGEIRNSLLDFATQKLLCTPRVPDHLTDAQMYAVLSQRLALDINTPQYLLTSPSPLKLMQTMHEQIANHMRVCVAVGEGVESLRAVASSEPILSEAASRIMQETDVFSLPSALSVVLSGFCINQGDRGELLVASFFTWARDQVILRTPTIRTGQVCHYFSVKSLFSRLFSNSVVKSILDDKPLFYHSEAARLPFGEVFDKARMHFNHVIKPQEQSLLARRFFFFFLFPFSFFESRTQVSVALHGTRRCRFGRQLSAWLRRRVPVLVRRYCPQS